LEPQALPVSRDEMPDTPVSRLPRPPWSTACGQADSRRSSAAGHRRRLTPLSGTDASGAAHRRHGTSLPPIRRMASMRWLLAARASPRTNAWGTTPADNAERLPPPAQGRWPRSLHRVHVPSTRSTDARRISSRDEASCTVSKTPTCRSSASARRATKTWTQKSIRLRNTSRYGSPTSDTRSAGA